MIRKDLVGLRFGRLLVVSFAGIRRDTTSGRSRRYWNVFCDCGNSRTVSGSGLASGCTSSCGCLKHDITVLRNSKAKYGKYNLKHGDTKTLTPTYRSWMYMKARCLNKNTDSYSNYGGRGVTVCDAWLNSYEQFKIDMGERPLNHSLERRDVNGNYTPENCYWATTVEQSYNKRSTVTTPEVVEYILKEYEDGATTTRLAKVLGISASTVTNIVNRKFKMPFHEYVCPLGHKYEKFFKTISEGESVDRIECPECGGTANKVFSKPLGFHLYGDPAGYSHPSPTKRHSTKIVSVKDGNRYSGG